MIPQFVRGVNEYVPNFAKAEIADTTADLSEYKTFLKRLAVGQVVRLPLDKGETSRKVMRSLNSAAHQSNMRLTRLPSGDGAVAFKVATPQKRAVNISPEARRARVEKAKATRAARTNSRARRSGSGTRGS